MEAKIRPLEHKYYGTIVDIYHPNGVVPINIWFSGGSGQPSERELADVPEGENPYDYIDGSHMETVESYEIAKLICEAINGTDGNKKQV